MYLLPTICTLHLLAINVYIEFETVAFPTLPQQQLSEPAFWSWSLQRINCVKRFSFNIDNL